MSEHTCLISSYQLLITAACTNTVGKMKGRHSRAADRCPFVPRHSLSQVTSFMQLGMLCAHAPGMLGMFSRQRLQRKPLVSNSGMHHGTCVTHVLWCMSGSLTHGSGENIPDACATRNFTYLARGPCIFLRGSFMISSMLTNKRALFRNLFRFWSNER